MSVSVGERKFGSLAIPLLPRVLASQHLAGPVGKGWMEVWRGGGWRKSYLIYREWQEKGRQVEIGKREGWIEKYKWQGTKEKEKRRDGEGEKGNREKGVEGYTPLPPHTE